MQTLQTVLLILQVLVAVALIGIILIQHGKGADAGAAFGSGASSTVFGAQGSGNFLTRTTSVLALIFLVNSLALAYIAGQRVQDNKSLMQGTQLSGSVMQEQQGQEAKPAAPESKQEKTGDSGTGSDVPTAPQ
jgi:preprotein translocase subunit SecG